jgi:hypothetical protein
MTYFALSTALRSVSAHINDFHRIVPSVSGEKTQLTCAQIQRLYELGCSVNYLLLGTGRKFNYSAIGRALQAQYEQLSQENFTRNLNSMIERTLFSNSTTTICEKSFLEQQ